MWHSAVVRPEGDPAEASDSAGLIRTSPVHKPPSVLHTASRSDNIDLSLASMLAKAYCRPHTLMSDSLVEPTYPQTASADTS
jgi:hypothetical protein